MFGCQAEWRWPYRHLGRRYADASFRMYEEDTAEGILLAAERYNNSEPVNLGSAFEISIKDLVVMIENLASVTDLVVTVEEHTAFGGLGSAVSEVLAAKSAGKRASLLMLNTGTQARTVVGSQTYLRECLNLDAVGITRAVLK